MAALALVLLFTNAYYIFVAGKVVAVIPTKMNILYSGIENPVTITVSNTDPKNLTIATSYGATIALDSSVKGTVYYKIRPISPAKQVTVTVTVKTPQGAQEVYTRDFVVKKAPDPNVFANKFSGNAFVPAQDLRDIRGLNCRQENFEFPSEFKVVSFMMSFRKDGEWVDLYAESGEITPEMKIVLATAKPADRIFFHDVNVKGDDSELRLLCGPSVIVR